jgi:uncharacterized cupin superfamily protein
MSSPHITRLIEESLLTSEPVEYLPTPEKILSGNPLQRVWSQYTDASQRFSVGIWECEPGAWRIHYTEEEYCRVMMGRSRLTNADGVVREVTAGDEFVIPRGFEGVWEVIERTRKVYVIYEAGDAQ